MRLAPSACVYVGDAPQDVEMAQRAGVRAIGVLGPFPRKSVCARPGRIFLFARSRNCRTYWRDCSADRAGFLAIALMVSEKLQELTAMALAVRWERV